MCVHVCICVCVSVCVYVHVCAHSFFSRLKTYGSQLECNVGYDKRD